MNKPQIYDAAVSALYETVLDPTQWSVALQGLSTYFEAPNVALFDYDFVTQTPSNFRLHGFDAAVGRNYASYYHHLDPGRSVVMAAAVGEWVADEPILDLRSTRHGEYIHDFALPSDIGRVAGCKVSGDVTDCLYLSLNRPPGAERFGDAGLRAYRAIEPHLRRIARMQQQIDELTRGQALARAALDRLRVAVALVDRNGQVELVNAHGAALLGGSGPVAIRQRRMVCWEPMVNERLYRLIRDACTTPSRGGALRVPRGSGASDLLLMIVPLPPSHELAEGMVEPLAIVVVGDPETDHATSAVYREMFGLTAAEASLLAALARGQTVSELTAQRQTSVATLRTQLHALFEKTGAHSQARLVALAKSVPPVR